MAHFSARTRRTKQNLMKPKELIRIKTYKKKVHDKICTVCTYLQEPKSAVTRTNYKPCHKVMLTRWRSDQCQRAHGISIPRELGALKEDPTFYYVPPLYMSYGGKILDSDGTLLQMLVTATTPFSEHPTNKSVQGKNTIDSEYMREDLTS